VSTGAVINGIATATSGSPLERAKLGHKFRFIEQIHTARINERQKGQL